MSLAVKQTVAVIDIGSTAIRLEVAQTAKNSRLKTLVFLQEGSKIGHDTFTSGSIRRSTIEECVETIGRYLTIIREHGITDAKSIRIIATAVIGEADNRDAFIDRIYSASGLVIQVIEEIDVARYTYLSFHELLRKNGSLGKENVLLIKMGGSSTEILYIKSGNVHLSSNFAFGSLRLCEMLDRNNTPLDHHYLVIDRQIEQTIHKILKSMEKPGAVKILLTGSSARFIRSTLVSDKKSPDVVAIPLRKLTKLSDDTIAARARTAGKNPDLRMETTGPVLRFYSLLGKAFNRNEVYVSDISMRHGVLIEMTHKQVLLEAFSDQVLEPALEVGKRYHFEERHARHVSRLAGMLFDALQTDHQLSPWHRLLLSVAALLHDTGLFVSMRSHHKHSMYLIRNSELFGLSHNDILLVALMARYHRRSSPKLLHEGYSEISLEDRLVVKKCAAILRIADALDNSHSQRVTRLRFERIPGEIVLVTSDIADATIEQVAIREKGSLFEDVYGLKPRIKTKK